MRVALLQSVAVLAGVSPVLPRPATTVGPSRPDEAVEAASRVAPRGSDALELSPAALRDRDERDDRQAERRDEPGRPGPALEPASAPASASPAAAPGAGEGEGRADADDASASRPAAESARAAAAEPAPAAAGPRGRDGKPLTDGEQRQVQELQARDQEVRTHEQAHKAAGGRYAGAINYEYSEGPDGQRYATGGSVSIDASPVSGDPQATIAKMQVVRAAALAPAEPSSQDRKVAAQADRSAGEARQEIAREAAEPAEDDAQAASIGGPRGADESQGSTDLPGPASDSGVSATTAEGPPVATPDGRPTSEPAAPSGSESALIAPPATDPAADAGAASAASPAPGRLELAAAAYRRTSNPAAAHGPTSGFDPAAWTASAIRGPRLDLVG